MNKVNMGSLKAQLLAAACLLAVQLVASEQRELPPFKDASLTCHRLPVHVEPTSYDLHLKFPSLDSDVYEGQVDIDVDFYGRGLLNWVQIYNPCVEENTIVLHADKRIEIQSITVTSEPRLSSFDGEPKELKITELVRDEAKQMIAIKVKDGIHPSQKGTPGKVSITFKGRMSENKRGVYVSTYNDGETVYKHIVSQFQPTGARTAFPCFDDPQFRVPFSLRVSYPTGLTAYGNTEAEEVSEEGVLSSSLFAATAPIPVHMVAFAIGEFDEPLEVDSFPPEWLNSISKGRKIRVITAPGKREAGHFALEVAKKSLEEFEKFMNYEFPLDKLDVIAIADLERDNTEGWGLVFVRDTLLWIDDETKTDTQITTALNVAHVVAHQWFGGLISVEWWSDLWITEGVAAQWAFFVAGNFYEKLGSKFFVRLERLSRALQADQAANLHPLSPPKEKLQTSEQIYGLFDDLEFVKSASMAEMVLETLKDAYERSLRKLIKEHAYKTINFEDYQRALFDGASSGTDKYLTTLLNTFPKFNGVPLVSCSTDYKEMSAELTTFDEARRDSLRREEFELAVKVRWLASSVGEVEDKIIVSNDKNNHNNFWLGDETFLPDAPRSFMKLDCNPTFVTYYRTRYSDEIYELLQKVIINKRIWALDRVQIIDDANSLVQAKLIKPDQFKGLLNSYWNETHPAVVWAVQIATDTYRRLSPDDVDSLESNKVLFSVFEKYGFKATGEEKATLQRARQVVLTSLIKQGNKQVIDAALKASDQNFGYVVPFLREPVYTAVVMSGSSERVTRLLTHLSATKSYEEKIRLVTALTLSHDEEVLTKVKSWLESSGLKANTIKPFLDTISKTVSQ